MKRVVIEPITRLEGHGRIDLFLDDGGRVERAFLMIPELRGFEKFLEGRPIEEVARITTRICGVCPEAHHMAAAKAVDAVFGVTIPAAAEVIRRLQYNAFVAGDHATHFYALGGPDFIVGPDAPPAERNLLGVVKKVGAELGRKVIRMRREAHEVAELLGGRRINAVGMMPGGVSRAVTDETRRRLIDIGDYMVEFALLTQQIFADVVLANPTYVSLIQSDTYRSETYYMALVDDDERLDHTGHRLRVIDPNGRLVGRWSPASYARHIAERVEGWSYLKVPYLKKVGWRGLTDGVDSGLYRVGPLAMLNASRGMKTPLAQREHDRFYGVLGPKPVHATLAYHWARIIEMLQCAEIVAQLARDERLTDPTVRVVPTGAPSEGVGCVEAPRGILLHHYTTDAQGMITSANLMVGTNHNYGPIQLSVAGAAKSLIVGGDGPAEPLLNQIEMAFRAYDPCFACATHALPGTMGLGVDIRGADGTLLRSVTRESGSTAIADSAASGGL